MKIGHIGFDNSEILAAIRVLLSGKLTYGAETEAFERLWSEWLGVPYSVMVNSGSSANLLALEALKHEGRLQPDDEVIVPAVAWSTSLFPIVQIGCVPVMIDVDATTLNIDPAAISSAITKRTRAILVVHLLGNPCDMHSITDRFPIIEDCCEAHGAEICGRRIGTFGDYSTFSFFFAHHMTCGEGGIVSCQTQEQRDLLMSLRSHGWARERSDFSEWQQSYPDIDARWIFVTPGYNFRPTDIQAAFAREQLKKLDGFITRRIELRERLLSNLAQYAEYFDFQTALPGHVHSAFGFALICKPPIDRKHFVRYLNEHGIETRPIIGGNLARQPALKYIPHRVHGDLKNADRVHFNGLMIPNHPGISETDQDRLCELIDGFIRVLPAPSP